MTRAMFSHSSVSLVLEFSNCSNNSSVSSQSDTSSNASTLESTWVGGPISFSNAPTLAEKPHPSSSSSSVSGSESKWWKHKRPQKPTDLENGPIPFEHPRNPADTEAEKVATPVNKREWLHLPSPKGTLHEVWEWTEIPTWMLGISTICGHPIEPACSSFARRACLHTMLFAGIFLLSLVDIRSPNTRQIQLWGWCLTVSMYFSYMALLLVDHQIWESREAARKEAERWEVERLFVDGGRSTRRNSRM